MSYEIIPQAPRYEMNVAGTIRNRTTGKILKWQISPHGTKTAQLYLGDKKKICVTLPNLLWQLHGRCTSKVAAIPCSIKKGTRCLRFDSMSDCARFLAKVTHYNYGGAYRNLASRRTKIVDWEIRYIDPKENPVTKGIE
ncbi:MAG: hypothetical protein IJG32_03950 [Selenomonadaceae bacterium]|nr:hypothetical protein [Selenomonadaceae bacterium]